MQINAAPSEQNDLVVTAPALEEGDDEPPDSLNPCPLPERNPRPSSAGRIVRFPAPHDRSRAQAVKSFRKQFYPQVPAKLWNDWHWQVANRIRTAEQLRAMLVLSAEEEAALTGDAGGLPLSITPYYMSLLHRTDVSQALRRSVVP